MKTKNTLGTALVTIISIWSKAPEIGRHDNYTYTVQVPRASSAQGTLEQAFLRTNVDDRPYGQECCSTTAGDMMLLDGKFYLVENTGFRFLTVPQAEAIKKLTSRDTSWGLEGLVKGGHVPDAKEDSAPKMPPATPANIAAFELGFRLAEKGMNLQAALAEFKKIVEG